MGALVQSNRGYESASDNSWAVAYTSNVTSGNLLVVTIAAYHASATISTIADTRSTSWNQAGTLLRGTGSTAVPFLACYYGIAPGSGANTVTITFSTAVTDKEITVWEISGVNTTTPLNATQSAAGALAPGITLIDTPSITTTAPGFIIKSLIEWAWGTHNQAAGTPTTGWTEYGDTATGADQAYRNETGTGTFTGGFTVPAYTNSGYCARIMAFADAAGGTSNPISLSGSLTGAGSLVRRANKPFAGVI